MPHNLPDHKKGDTFLGEIFTMTELIDEVSVPINLTDVQITMDLRDKPAGSLIRRFTNYDTNDPAIPGGGLSILDAALGKWRIDPQVLDFPPKTYVYDVEFLFPTLPEEPLDIQTLIDGTWTFTQDVTRRTITP